MNWMRKEENMIDISDLKSSIYSHFLFEQISSKINFLNEKDKGENVLRNVNLVSDGSFIRVGNNLLKGSKDIYHKEDGNLSFQQDCDGVCLLHRSDNRNFLILTEIKSGYANMQKKAFFQLITSYVRIKTWLATIDTYYQNDYEEIGLIISYPETNISDNSGYTDYRNTLTSKWGNLINKYSASLRRTRFVDMKISDFGIDKLHISPQLLNDTLRVRHVEVTKNAETCIVNIDEIIGC